MHAAVLPEPTGPAMSRPYASDFMKRAQVGEAVNVRSAIVCVQVRLECYVSIFSLVVSQGNVARLTQKAAHFACGVVMIH